VFFSGELIGQMHSLKLAYKVAQHTIEKYGE